MRPDFLGLEAFVAIAERSSFNKAADHLGITQTALSHRMRKLESQLGTSLLQRTTRSVALTPAGQNLLPKAKHLIEEAKRTFRDLEVEAMVRHERIAIGCLPTLAINFLPRVLREFSALHPRVHVRVFDNSASEIAKLVQCGEAEFGLTMLATNLWDLDITPLVKESYVLVCRRDHKFAKQGAVRWSELAGESLIRIAMHTGNRILIDDALGGASERMLWRSEVQHLATAVALVAADVGLAVVPRGAIDGALHNALTYVPLRRPSITRTVGVASRHGVPHSQLGATLLQIIYRHAPALRGVKSRRSLD